MKQFLARPMAVDKKITLVFFTLWASIYAESTDEQFSTAWTANESQTVNCTIHEDSQLSNIFLTCLFPFDVSSKEIGFDVQAFQKTEEQGDPVLIAGCMWHNGLTCLPKEGYLLQRGQKVKTHAVFKIPIEEAKSHVYSCNLALKTHFSNPCSLPMQVSDKDNTAVIVGTIAAVCIPVVMIIVWLVCKRFNKLENKGGEDLQKLTLPAAVDSLNVSINEQQNVKDWIEEQRNFLFECKNLADDVSKSQMDQFMKKNMELICEIKFRLRDLSKDSQENSYQLLEDLLKEADCALKLLENLQEPKIRRKIISKLRVANQGSISSNLAVENFLSDANCQTDKLWAEGNKDLTSDVNFEMIKTVKSMLAECLHLETSLNQRLVYEKSGSAVELVKMLHALEKVRSEILDLKVLFLDNLQLSVERDILKRNVERMCTKMSEDEFLDCHLPSLTSASYIIPENSGHHECTNTNFSGSNHPVTYRINDLDIAHQTIHDCLVQIKEKISTREFTVMLTQTSFSLYDTPFSSLSSMAVGESIQAQEMVADPEHIFLQKKKYSDFIVIDKLRGVLGGVIQNVHISDPTLAKDKLHKSVFYLTKAANIMKKVVKTVSETDSLTVHTTLVLPNITRAQLFGCTMVQKAVEQVPCLCKDEMASVDSLTKWWDSCWSSDEHPRGLDKKVYRRLVSKFAIPALGVHKYLTSLQQVETQAGNTAGDIDVIHAAANLSALPLNLAQLLDFDSFDDTQDDVKLLFGPPGTGKSTCLKVGAMQWASLNANRIFILQTSTEARAASNLMQTQLQQMLRAKQQQPDAKERNRPSKCLFTLVDVSGHWKVKQEEDKDEGGATLTNEGKKMLDSSFGLSLRRQSENTIHILADEASGHVVVALYFWLKEKGVQKVRLWAAGMEVAPVAVPASLRHAVVQLTPDPAPMEKSDKSDLTG